MALLDEIKKIADENSANLTEHKGIYTFQVLVAERKACMSKKRLEYIAKFRIDDAEKELKFTEMLKETGSGLSVGSPTEERAPGFGFKATVYKTGIKGRSGTIEEQSNLFGKTYEYKFDYKAVRAKFDALAKAAGYNFKYQITPIGL